MNNNNCISDMKEEYNSNIYDRNIPGQMLQPYLNVRPVSTKYSVMPIVDPRKNNKTMLQNMPTFNTQTTFNPGTDNAPWSGYASNVNIESELKNQIYGLQKCSQSIYVPNSDSDLYEYKYKPKMRTDITQHQLLFQPQSFNTFDPNPSSDVIGINFFNNSTRDQLKNMVNPKCN